MYVTMLYQINYFYLKKKTKSMTDANSTLPLFQCEWGSLMPMQVADEVPAGAAVEEDRTS